MRNYATHIDRLFIVAGGIGLGILLATVRGQAPDWWTERSVLSSGSAANDFAPLNQGQLKWIATNAALEFEV